MSGDAMTGRSELWAEDARRGLYTPGKLAEAVNARLGTAFTAADVRAVCRMLGVKKARHPHERYTGQALDALAGQG